MNQVYSIQSEWLKTRRSTASWLCLIGGFFIPVVYFIVFLKDGSSINHVPPGLNGWKLHFDQLWQVMSMFLLPMGVILSSSLITQVEYRNNTWKQLHTTPQRYTTIFISKFIVILLMTLKFFVFFNVGILLSGILPSLFFDGKFPEFDFPVSHVLTQNAAYFIACLPVIAIQFLISLRFKNFLVPIGIGFLLLVGTLIGIEWKHIVISPFSYCPLQTVHLHYSQQTLLLMATGYFIVLMLISYALYISRSEKG